MDQISEDSLDYALRMRKYQIETLRREVPHGGYVVSVIRDFPLASMGLLDPWDRPKWPFSKWSWHREQMILLTTPRDRFCFREDQPLKVRISLATTEEEYARPSDVELVLRDESGTSVERKRIRWDADPAFSDLRFQVPADTQRKDDLPRRFTLQAHSANHGGIANAWSLWTVPPRVSATWSSPWLRAHASLSADQLPSGVTISPLEPQATAAKSRKLVVLTSRLDEALLSGLESGGAVILLPNNHTDSFPTREHWFLRGGPVIHSVGDRHGALRRFVLELQHFDLAGPVVPEIDHYLADVEPWVVLWDNHDLADCRTHGVLFRIPVGKGTLWVSTMNHRAEAGRWLLEYLIRELRSAGQTHTAESAVSTRWLERFRRELAFRKLALESKTWRFRPDLHEEGVA
ncbi:MAG TPA: hypothetical protein VIY86_14735, partial [Pirellulaceae bacterium]